MRFAFGTALYGFSPMAKHVPYIYLIFVDITNYERHIRVIDLDLCTVIKLKTKGFTIIVVIFWKI